MSDDFSRRLKEIRIARNLTLAEFADLGDVSTTTQGLYERENEEERRYPDIRYLLNLSSHNIDIHYLLFGEKKPEDVISDKSVIIINAYENTDSNHRLAFEALAAASPIERKSKKKKDDHDNEPPSSSTTNKNKMKNVVIGGDMMQNSNKNTIHNYNEDAASSIPLIFNASEKEKAVIHKIEDAVKHLNAKEVLSKTFAILFITFISLFIMKLLGSVPTNNFGEEVLSLVITLLFPLVTWIILFKISSNLINNLYKTKKSHKIRRMVLN